MFFSIRNRNVFFVLCLGVMLSPGRAIPQEGGPVEGRILSLRNSLLSVVRETFDILYKRKDHSLREFQAYVDATISQCSFIDSFDVDLNQLIKECHTSVELINKAFKYVGFSSRISLQNVSIDQSVRMIQNEVTRFESFIKRRGLLKSIKDFCWGSRFSYSVFPQVLALGCGIGIFSMFQVKGDAFTNEVIDRAKKRGKSSHFSGEGVSVTEQMFETLKYSVQQAWRDSGLSADDFKRVMKHGTLLSGAASGLWAAGMFRRTAVPLMQAVQQDAFDARKEKRELAEHERRFVQERRVNVEALKNASLDEEVVTLGKVQEKCSVYLEAFSNPLKLRKMGIKKCPQGILLSGPPGVGKTFLARHCIRDARFAAWSIKSSELQGDDVLSSKDKVSLLFDAARNASPSILFIDEFDFVGNRDASQAAGDVQSLEVLDNLLSELDGLKRYNPYKPILIIATTNKPENLDAALIRPGRFDLKVPICFPDDEHREKIISKELSKIASATERECFCALDMHKLVAMTEGCSIIDLIGIVREVRLRSVFGFGSGSVSLEAFERAKRDVMA